MKRIPLSVHAAVTVFLVLFLSTTGFAQIQITDSDVLALRGSTFLSANDERESFSVNVGSPGANQTWDLTGQSIPNPIIFQASYLDPQNTPYDTAFEQQTL